LNIFTFKLHVFLCLLLLGAFTSCELAQPNTLPFTSDVPVDLQEKLNRAEDSNVDSALYYSNLILDYIRENKLSDSLYIHYNSIQAFLLVSKNRQDQALQLLMDNYLLASANRDSMLSALTSLDLANYYNIIFQSALALPYATTAVNYLKAHPGHFEAGRSLNNLGRIYLNEGDLYQALECFNLVAAINTANRDTLELASALAEIGYTMLMLGLSEPTIDATRKGIQLLSSIPNSPAASVTLGNLAINYKGIYPDSAIFYQQKAIELSSAMGDSLNWIAGIYNLGNTLFRIGKFEEAEKKILQVYDYCKKNGIQQGIILSYNALSDLYISNGKPETAIKYATLATIEFKEMGLNINMVNPLQNLISAHTQLGDLQQAQKLQGELDSLQNQMQLLQTQSIVKYIEQAMTAERSAFNNQLLQQKNTATATTVQRRTYSIVFLLLAMAVSAVLGLRWKSDNQSAQQAIQVLLQRYAKDIQQKKLSGQSLAEDNFYPQLAQKLIHLMEVEKIHLQPDLKLEDVLQSLQISYRDLNQLLKSEFQTTFTQLINQYRISTAQQLLSNRQNRNISLDKIATLSGFGTRQSFYNIFQSETGVSPGIFRNYLLSNLPSENATSLTNLSGEDG